MDEAVKAAVKAAVSADGLLAVRVTPKASANRIAVAHGRMRVFVTAPPDKGRANEAALALIAKTLSVPKSAVTLVRGARAREKVFKIVR
jgi:hypothetical protein